jgi:hypothetical protein
MVAPRSISTVPFAQRSAPARDPGSGSLAAADPARWGHRGTTRWLRSALPEIVPRPRAEDAAHPDPPAGAGGRGEKSHYFVNRMATATE